MAYGAFYRLAFLYLFAALEEDILLAATQAALLIYFPDTGVSSAVIRFAILVTGLRGAFMYYIKTPGRQATKSA